VSGEVPTAPTITMVTGTPSGILTEIGENPAAAGVIPSQSQTDLTPGYLARGRFSDVGSRAPKNIPETIQWIALAVSGVPRVRLRVLAISFARVALR